MVVEFCIPGLNLNHAPNSHRNVNIRKLAAQFFCTSLELYGPAKLLHSPRDLVEKSLNTVAQLVSDATPEPR